jgi:hypothetical protein
MGIATKNIHGYNIYCLDDAKDCTERIVKSSLKSASTEPKISSWARLYLQQETHEPVKSASTKEPEISSWARLYRLNH